MADREKLIELINDHTCLEEKDNCAEECAVCLADYLIANGVTIQPLTDCKQPVTDNNVGCKWIPVTERLPELIPCNAGTAYSEAVIVWTDNRKAMVAVWDGIDFLCAAGYWEAWGEKITHWMPLPEPPKGK